MWSTYNFSWFISFNVRISFSKQSNIGSVGARFTADLVLTNDFNHSH
ncbi:hypothetical protein J40TS1_16860 [Paenibacillus montaniterrae]|uniref:Uncharacterized protein n=1 Tax=Paenibacillus montaniterrae TaxID=429341 RepID=A0A920CYH5_9BACL|nr:hypothetical protein J40TS1_16860 [Paenibacillus montaniterrae]